eukprot:TRINITY_DN19864_c0_g1_i1.p1 TRINITY_DN19864_c0_g1~~TRINITY_DN19864_c0_g1_i1.p1  ORF type:complete len:244 (+),score=45.39 TRINITY_DN19864_c0_g1_i1:169-900(+)
MEGAFAAATPCEGGKIFGVMHQLSQDQLLMLDELEGVQDGQNERVGGAWATPLHKADGKREECTLYVCGGSAMRLSPTSSAKPSARYLELLEFSSREAGLPEAWADKFQALRLSLPSVPRTRIEDMTRKVPRDIVNHFSLAELSKDSTSLCGVVFDCSSASAPVTPGLVGKEVSLAVLRRSTKTWLGEVVPSTMAEARHSFGEERVNEILQRWLTQFCSSFGNPVGLLTDDWELCATPHRLVL